jgi:hypothetical protein
MTGAELRRARELLIISEASCAAMLGWSATNVSGAFAASDIISAETIGGTIANNSLNIAAEKILRPFLNSQGIRP